MHKLILLLTFSFAGMVTFAQSNKVTDYINQYKDIAMEEMQRTGVPASITLAQGILESGCGQSTLAKESNNHFGIKCKPEWTGGKTFHNDDARNECFRVYASAEDSYRDHSDFLKNRPYYTDLFLLNPRDYKNWAYGLKKDGYATEKDYPQNLIRIIETYHLEDYSEMALQKNNHNNIDNYAINVPAALPDATLNGEATVNSSDIKIPVHTPPMRVAQTIAAPPAYPASTFYINKTKVVYAPKGLSLLALAAKYNVNFNKLLVLNDLDESVNLSSGQLIYLGKKPKKGNKDFYTAAYGETLRNISDKAGVALKSLEEYNGITAKDKLASGQTIYLRYKRESAPKTIE